MSSHDDDDATVAGDDELIAELRSAAAAAAATPPEVDDDVTVEADSDLVDELRRSTPLPLPPPPVGAAAGPFPLPPPKGAVEGLAPRPTSWTSQSGRWEPTGRLPVAQRPPEAVDVEQGPPLAWLVGGGLAALALIIVVVGLFLRGDGGDDTPVSTAVEAPTTVAEGTVPESTEPTESTEASTSTSTSTTAAP